MQNIWADIPVYIIIFHIISVIAVLFIERKHPVTTIAWVLTLLFLPIIGVMAYVFIGSTRYFNVNRKFRLKQEIDKNYKEIIKEQLEHLKNGDSYISDPQISKYSDIITMHLTLSDSFYSDDNQITLFLNGKDKYESLFEDIRNAKSSVHLMYYIFNTDNIGTSLIELLAKKAAEGVEVRLVYDSFGNLRINKKKLRPLIKAGGKVVPFLPNPLVNLMRVNYRNHRKIAVIDGKTAYLGGINIGDEYMGLDKRKTPWRDTHMRIIGSAAFGLQLRFLNDWWYLSGETDTSLESAVKYFSSEKSDGNIPMQIVSSGPDSPEQEIKYGILKIINSAKKSLYIQTPYLIPDETVLESLRLSVKSGVDVRIMIPGIPDKRFVYYATLSYVDELLQSGIKVYAYNGFLHSKTIVADGEIASIGTMNLDMRGFHLAFEVNAFIYGNEFPEKCKKVFEDDIKNCKQIDAVSFKKRSVLSKILENIFRLLSPLM